MNYYVIIHIKEGFKKGIIMARDGVSAPEIYKACEALQAEGVQVTLVNVQKKLGRGSFSTIAPVVKTFKEKANELKAAEMIFEVPQIPSHIESQGKAFIAGLWETANNKAQAEIKELTQKHQLEITSKNKELEAATKEREQLTEELTSYQERCDLMSEEQEKLKSTIIQQTTEITFIKSQLTEKDKEIKSLVERAAAAERELELLKKDLSKKR
jgi:chromosome segregation ATPase